MDFISGCEELYKQGVRLTEEANPQHPTEPVLLSRLVKIDDCEHPVGASHTHVVGWLPSRHKLRPVGEDEVVTTRVGGMVDGLAMPLWGVPVVIAGQQRRPFLLTPGNRTLPAGMAEGHLPAECPMRLDVLIKVFLIAVSDLRERSAPRADDRRAIPRAATLVTVGLRTWKAMAIELPKEACRSTNDWTTLSEN